jgi:hydrogenase maturation protein HypF
MIARVAQGHPGVPVVLSGGCFQNRLLTELTLARLQAAGVQVYWHQRVPPNDGGIALGQVVAAARQLRFEEDAKEQRCV